MSYYDDEKNALDYIKMAEGYDGRDLITTLQDYLPTGATVLELGMGPGKDFEMLNQHYQATGSDLALSFLDRYRQVNPIADLLQLDAVTLKTKRYFDGIYSNKVLHHLTQAELQQSFKRQADLLNKEGVVLHSFWYGDTEEAYHGLRFVYYTKATLQPLIDKAFKLIKLERYTEMEANDSLVMVLQKN